MRIHFRVSPTIPLYGVKKVLKSVQRDLQNIIGAVEVMYWTDHRLSLFKGQRKVHFSSVEKLDRVTNREVITVYIISSSLWHGIYEVYGIASGTKACVSQYLISNLPYDLWESCLWGFILHEVGHVLGLVPKHANNKIIIYEGFNLFHCANKCLMQGDTKLSDWHAVASWRKDMGKPFCASCSSFLRSKKHTIRS